MQFRCYYRHFAVVQKFKVAFCIALSVFAFLHHFRKVLHKSFWIYALLFTTFDYVLQTACIIAPDEVYIPYIFAMKCAFNMPLLFSEQFVDGILSFYAFEFLT